MSATWPLAVHYDHSSSSSTQQNKHITAVCKLQSAAGPLTCDIASRHSGCSSQIVVRDVWLTCTQHQRVTKLLKCLLGPVPGVGFMLMATLHETADQLEKKQFAEKPTAS